MESSQYREWRGMILSVAPQIELKNIPDEVHGMLMDVGMGDGHGNFPAISLYALHTGEAFLKASPGAGVVGLALQRRFILLRHVEYYYDVSESQKQGQNRAFSQV